VAGHEQLGGVRTWYDEHGVGEPLALLHPGGADARAWAPNLDALAAHFHVFTPERRGHGRTPDVEGPIDGAGHHRVPRGQHAIAMYRGLPDAELAVVPGTSHGLLYEKPALCNTS
jgi:pimeloyl-ACP methyl ester carboxylesterase